MSGFVKLILIQIRSLAGMIKQRYKMTIKITYALKRNRELYMHLYSLTKIRFKDRSLFIGGRGGVAAPKRKGLGKHNF
jgi:hypothetical protein